MRFLAHRATVALCQTVVAVAFAAAALPGIASPAAFARTVHNLAATPGWLENPLAIALPWIALTLAVAILLRARPRAGASVALGVLVLLSVALAAAALRHIDLSCGCPGSGPATRVALSRLGQVAGLLAAAVVGCLRPR